MMFRRAMMAGPLYKRYVPPSRNPASAVSAQPVAQTTETEGDNAQQNGTSTAEGKRKRERSEEEAAERKAKKLRRKAWTHLKRKSRREMPRSQTNSLRRAKNVLEVQKQGRK